MRYTLCSNRHPRVGVQRACHRARRNAKGRSKQKGCQNDTPERKRSVTQGAKMTHPCYCIALQAICVCVIRCIRANSLCITRTYTREKACALQKRCDCAHMQGARHDAGRQGVLPGGRFRGLTLRVRPGGGSVRSTPCARKNFTKHWGVLTHPGRRCTAAHPPPADPGPRPGR